VLLLVQHVINVILFCHIIGIVIGPLYCWVIIYDKFKPWDVLLVIVVYFYFVNVKLKQGLILYNTTNIRTTLENSKTCECKPFYYCKNVWGGTE
jgi:hypothetical protein